ncbi:MAG: hypothetical protein M3547_09150 [Acidobacteriota bacterium]|nr:hypothetical protein [Acidobacteriota bacterium]
MKETRAVILGFVVVLIFVSALAYWRRPAPEFARVKGFQVQVQERENGNLRRVSFSIPSNLVARVAKLVPMDRFGADINADWDENDVTPREILEAADQSTPGHPTVLEKNGKTIEVQGLGSIVEVRVKDGWGKNVHVRLPRAIVESVSGGKDISPREVLQRIDELGPGDVIHVQDGDNVVTITAQARDPKK